MEKLKINPVSMKVHPEFRDELILEIIDERVKSGLERASKAATCLQITKIILNFFKANPKLKAMLLEVRINGE